MLSLALSTTCATAGCGAVLSSSSSEVLELELAISCTFGAAGRDSAGMGASKPGGADTSGGGTAAPQVAGGGAAAHGRLAFVDCADFPRESGQDSSFRTTVRRLSLYSVRW